MRDIERFSTERLNAERLSADHFEELCRMHHDERVMATLGGTRSDDDTYRYLLKNLDHWKQHGYGLWIFRDKETNAFAGRGGIRHLTVEGKDEIELAYALRSEYWGKGLATEMAKNLVTISFEKLALPDLVALTLTTNKASQRVMKKAGLTLEREIVHSDVPQFPGLPHVIYRIQNTAKSE
jgi:RimJ/RimL family protein N-acetyltransferase